MNISSTMPVIRDGKEIIVEISGRYCEEEFAPPCPAEIVDIESNFPMEFTDKELEQAEQTLWEVLEDSHDDPPDWREDR